MWRGGCKAMTDVCPEWHGGAGKGNWLPAEVLDFLNVFTMKNFKYRQHCIMNIYVPAPCPAFTLSSQPQSFHLFSYLFPHRTPVTLWRKAQAVGCFIPEFTVLLICTPHWLYSSIMLIREPSKCPRSMELPAFDIRQNWVEILPPTSTCCVALVKLLNLSGPHFLHLQNKDNKTYQSCSDN